MSDAFRIGNYFLGKRPNSESWCRCWFDTGTRQTRRQSLGTQDFERAKTLLAEWVTVNVTQHKAAAADVKLSDVFVQYFHHHARHVASAGSIRRHLFLVLEIVEGDPMVSEFGPRSQDLVISELRKRKYAPGMVKRIMTSAKAAVLWGWKQEIITTHPPFVTVADGEPRERIMTIDEIAALWDAAEQPHLQAFIIGLLCTLARPGTVLDLTRGQLDLDRGLIDLNGGRKRTAKRRPTIPMAAAFRPWAASCGAYLVEYRGKPVKKINAVWRNARAAAGLSADVVPYSIRHTMASELAGRGVPELEIAGMCGHIMPNMKTTARYIKFRADYLRNAVQAIDDVVNEIGRVVARPIVPSNPVRITCVSARNSNGLGNPLISGAGDEIRTHDPNLGNIRIVK